MPLPPPSDTTTALVTGASSGIGEQFARKLAQRGHHVTLVARRRERLEALAAELGAAAIVPADLTDPAARDALGEQVRANGREVSVLVNNAGFGVYGAFRATNRAREIEQVRLLVEAVVDLSHRYFGEMCAHGQGAIVNVSSSSGFQAAPYNAGYAAAKAFVNTLSESLHGEGVDDGVTVTAVCPGPVTTEFQQASGIENFDKAIPRFAWVTPERVVDDALAAVEKGRRVVVPGGPIHQVALASGRYSPTVITNAVLKRAMARAT